MVVTLEDCFVATLLAMTSPCLSLLFRRNYVIAGSLRGAQRRSNLPGLE